MPRKARNLPERGMLHLIGRSNNTIRVFRKRADFERIKYILGKYLSVESFFLHHYVVMNTHFHLLLWSDELQKLSECMKAIFVSYQCYFKKQYPYKGHLWNSRYKSVTVSSDEQFMQCARYIELNPVHAGICASPELYRWSSFKHYAYGLSDPLIRKSNIVEYPKVSDGINKQYVEFVNAGKDLEYQRLKKRYRSEYNY